MSPILVRPVREQLEHDRLIRHLQAKYKRKFSEVAANVGDEQLAPVKIGANTFFPDLVLTADRKLVGLVEVESAESVNNLEALAQWVHFSRAKVPFHLYVPVHVYDAARRLCEANQARVTEIWTYRAALDGFDLVRIHAEAGAAAPAPRQSAEARAAGNGSKAPGSAPAKGAKAKPASRPAVKPASKPSAAKPSASKPSAAKPRKKPAPRASARSSRPAARAKRK